MNNQMIDMHPHPGTLMHVNPMMDLNLLSNNASVQQHQAHVQQQLAQVQESQLKRMRLIQSQDDMRYVIGVGASNSSPDTHHNRMQNTSHENGSAMNHSGTATSTPMLGSDNHQGNTQQSHSSSSSSSSQQSDVSQHGSSTMANLQPQQLQLQSLRFLVVQSRLPFFGRSSPNF